MKSKLEQKERRFYTLPLKGRKPKVIKNLRLNADKRKVFGFHVSSGFVLTKAV